MHLNAYVIKTGRQFFPIAQKPLVDHGLLIIEDTPHLLGPLWMSEKPYTETSK